MTKFIHESHFCKQCSSLCRHLYKWWSHWVFLHGRGQHIAYHAKILLWSNPIRLQRMFVCPWALIIVIAKQRRKGNCKRLNWNGISAVDGISGLRGMKATFPKAGPCSMITSITFAWHALTRHQVPLVMLGGSKDLRTITGHPILRA